MVTKNYVILHPSYGKEPKTTLPKSELKLADGLTVMERQIKSINKHVKNPSIYHVYQSPCEPRIEPRGIKKSHLIKDGGVGPMKMLSDAVNRLGIKSCYVMMGAMAYDDRHFPSRRKLSTVYTSQNYAKKLVGISNNNGYVTNMMWGLQNTWSGMTYFNKDIVSLMMETRLLPKYDKAFLFELINLAVDNDIPVKVEPLGSEVVRIYRPQDVDIANAKFSIG